MSSVNCALVVDQNLIDQRNSFSYSSQQTAYPATNAMDVNHRARTWRTQGYWRIVTGANGLVIRDATAGSDLTASVALGTYASDTLFFAALKAALEAVSDSTFTITRDATTNAITITAALGGAATHFLIRGAAAGSTIAPTLGFALTNISGSLSYVADVVKLHTEEFLIVDFGSPVSPTALFCFSDQSRAIRISPSATVRLQGNATDSVLAWDTPQVDVAVSVEDQGLGVVNRYGMGGSSAAAGTACRYWKLKIQDASNAFGHIELGAVVLGTHIALSRGNAVFPLQVNGQDLSQRQFSEGGQLLTSKRAQTRTLRLNWEGLTASEFDEVDEVFNTFGTHSAFAISLDESGAFSTNIMRYAKLVRMEAEPSDQLVSPNNWACSWSLREDL